jgi:hypothetical protein
MLDAGMFGAEGFVFLYRDSLWSYRDSEVEAECVCQAREGLEAGVVFSGLETRDGRLLHFQTRGERGLREVIFGPVRDEPRRDRAGKRSALPLSPKLGILELACEYVVT